MNSDLDIKIKCLEIAQQSQVADILAFAKTLFEWVKE
jgi:hypothetical protein